MTTKYCIIQKGLFGESVTNCGALYDNIEEAIVKCTQMSEKYMSDNFMVGKVEYEGE